MVYAGLPQYLSAALENVQRRALAIISPGFSYDVALASAGLSTLAARRDLLCTRFIANIVPDHPLYPLINSRLIDIPAHSR